MIQPPECFSITDPKETSNLKPISILIKKITDLEHRIYSEIHRSMSSARLSGGSLSKVNFHESGG